MIGIIVTGHGTFASGMHSAATTLTGYHEHFIPVDYDTEHDTPDMLEKKLCEAAEALRACKSIVVLCDILGGTPFKTAVMTFFGKEHVRVMYGTNVGLAMKLCMECMMGNDGSDLDGLCDTLAEEGKEHVGKYVFAAVQQEETEDGI